MIRPPYICISVLYCILCCTELVNIMSYRDYTDIHLLHNKRTGEHMNTCRMLWRRQFGFASNMGAGGWLGRAGSRSRWVWARIRCRGCTRCPCTWSCSAPATIEREASRDYTWKLCWWIELLHMRRSMKQFIYRCIGKFKISVRYKKCS